MGALSWLRGGNDRAMAKEYDGESATDRATRKAAEKTARRVARHHRSGATKAARAGQAWEDRDRTAEYLHTHRR